MREDIDIRLLDYYIYNLTKLSKSRDISGKQEKSESASNKTEEISSPESSN